MRKLFNPILNSIIWLATRGVNGQAGSAHDRITIFVNSLGLFGIFAVFPIAGTLLQKGIPIENSLYFISVLITAPLAIFFNSRNQHFVARCMILFASIYIGWGAGIFFGKSFNGHYIFFVSIILSLTAFVREHWSIRIGTFALAVSGLLGMDYFYHTGVFPITGFNSIEFPLSTLIFDTLAISGFISIITFIEKSFSEKYEAQLEDLNTNLETRVRERTEQLVKASEEAIAANMRKSQFVANTSHELRTPLQGILGFSQLADLKLNKLTPENFSKEKVEKIQEQIRRAQGNANRLLSLIERLLELTRFESDEERVFPSHFNMKDLIKSVIEETHGSEYYQKQKIEFVSQLDFENIFSDQVLYRQIITNLIVNAVKYSHEGSTINVKLFQEGELISCSVVNQGFGIPEDEVKEIFEPFYQSSATDRRVGGTGLGLTLCSKYARNLGGSLDLMSPDPEATEFKVSIKPLNKEEYSLPKAA